MNEEQLDRSQLSDRTVDFLKEQILANEKSHHDSSLHLVATSYRNTSILTLSASALIGFGSKAYAEGPSPISVACLAMGFHLALCALLLFTRVMPVGSFPALGNEPNILLEDDHLRHTKADVILSELEGKQESIDLCREANERKGDLINDTTVKSLLSPLTFAITFLLMVLVGS